MCGIIACRTREPALNYLVPALRRLEYRGYDSAGIAVGTAAGQAARVRAVGRIEMLEKRLSDWRGPELGGVGIGHTRWATHGGVTEQNAHPHTDCTGRIALVHNGIVENADPLRAELTDRGHEFESGVDSEVLAHLVEDAMSAGADLTAAVAAALARAHGSWAVAVLDGPTGRLVVGANRSPLVVARSERGDFAASDPAAIAEWVGELQVLRDGDVVELAEGHRWSGVDGPRTAPASTPCTWTAQTVELGGYRDFMAREIDEQPEVAARVLAQLTPGVAGGRLWSELGLPALRRVRVLACGTSLNAGRAVGGLLARLGRIPVTLSVASEADRDVVEPGTLTLAISQSGETADVLRALEGGPATGPLLALTNNPHSTLARRADAVLDCNAGPEIGVAATKTFVSQVLTGVTVALSGLAGAGRLDAAQTRTLVAELAGLPDRLAAATDTAGQLVPELGAELADATGYLFLARGSGLPYADEGALKLKELTYRWAESYPAGELKHGPLALVEDGTPVVVIDDGDPRLAGNIAEVRARGARVVTIGGPGTTIPVTVPRDAAGAPPWGPLETVVPLQVLARTVAIALDRDVDKPRNLAKSVTVE